MTVTFKPGNKHFYSQDFSFYQGVPPNIPFEFKFLSKEKIKATLTAPNYGEEGDYGNGAIFVVVTPELLQELFGINDPHTLQIEL